MQVGSVIRAAALAALLVAAQGGAAQDLSALARIDPASSGLTDAGGGIILDLALSQPVPFRVFLLADPPRLVLDTREIDFAGAEARALDRSFRVTGLRLGRFRDGWSRLVATLDGPYRIASAEERTDPARIMVRLEPATPEDFADRVARVPDPGWGRPEPVAPPLAPQPPRTDGPLVVALDPGHGGLDPGAEAGGLTEAELMLTFGRELADVLRRAGMTVVMTREEDVFVPLAQRVRLAREARADVFLSLHADALAEGTAVGATVYRLDPGAPDVAAARLAERHDRDDLLAGLDAGGADALVATVLIELARAQTQPRADRLADTIVDRLRGGGIALHAKPVQSAAFSVLKAPDMPSLLLELGFLSSQRDRDRLTDPDWRAGMQAALRDALDSWAREDAALAVRLRR